MWCWSRGTSIHVICIDLDHGVLNKHIIESAMISTKIELRLLIDLFSFENSHRCLLFMLISFHNKLFYLNPIQHGEGKKDLLPVFPLQLLVGTFWLLVFTLLPYWCKISSPYLVSIPNYWTWTKSTIQKYWFFWSNPYKTEVPTTSLIQMLELPNFGHMTTSTM